MTATEGLLAQNGNGVPSYNAPTKYDVNDIVMHFGREYYTMLSCEPERLHCFYGKQSSLLHCQEDETEATVCVGLEEIHERLASMGYNGARVVIGNIDCQPSMNGGILIFVLGTMHWPTGVVRKFAQTFLLAEQPNGYFVLNDIMRILSEVAVPNPVEKKPTVAKPVSIETVVSIPEPAIVADTKPQPQKPVAEPVVKEKTVEVEKPSKPAEKEKPVEKTLTKTGGDKKKQTQQTQSTPNKAVASQAEEERVTATTPSSWAKLAAVQQSRWQSGVVAESKGPVASIAVEGEKPTNEPSGRLNYRTNGDRRGESQSQRDQPRDGHSEKRSIPEYDPAKALYVHEISGRINRDQLCKKFEEFGAIKAFEAVIGKGIAFIEYETVEARNAAMNAKVVYNGSALAVEPRRAGRRDSQPRDVPTTQSRRHYTSSRNNNQQQPRE
jgi:outer membrane biosynthesis protein TonB